MGDIAAILGEQSSQIGQNAFNTFIARRFNLEDYNRTRKDALADWNMQNAYNHPKQQMQRLVEAGLNPNLVYGNGATATTSAPIRSGNLAPTKPEFNIKSPVDTMFRYQQVDQQKLISNNLRADYENKIAQNSLILANTMNTLKSVDLKSYEYAKKLYEQNAGLWETTTETAKQNLVNKRIQGQTMISEDSRREMENLRREKRNDAETELVISRLGQIVKQNQLTDAQRRNVEERTKQLQIIVANENLNQGQGQAMTDLIMNNAIVDNILKGQRITSETEEQVIKMFRIKAMKMGVSTEYAEKMALSMISLFK